MLKHFERAHKELYGELMIGPLMRCAFKMLTAFLPDFTARLQAPGIGRREGKKG